MIFAGKELRSSLRTVIGCSLQLAWWPVVSHCFTTSLSALNISDAAVLIAFLLSLSLVGGIASFLRIATLGSRWTLLVQLLLVFIGLALTALSYVETQISVLLRLLAFTLLGAGCALLAIMWEPVLVSRSDKQTVPVVLGALVVFALAFSASAYMEQTVICLLAGFACLASTILWQKQSVPAADAAVRESKMLETAGSRLLIRYCCSFAGLGFCSGAMVFLFASGIPTPPDVPVTDYAALGVLATGLLLLLGWIRNREFDFLFSFSFLMLVALLTFFPINPGTKLNQHLSLIMSEVWAIALIGTLFLVSKKVDELCFRIGRSATGLGFSSLFFGSCIGLVAMFATMSSPWFQELEQGAHDKIVLVTTCGAISLALSYICTNMLISGNCLRNVKLISKGKYPSPLQLPLIPKDTDAEDDEVQGFGASLITNLSELELRCRAVSLEKKLTPREYEVLVVLAYGNNLSRVQSELVISEGTAITHRRNIYRKLDVHSKQELLDFIFQPPSKP
jgi:DNA-binding CsgD family transcriptional regulator